MAKPAVCISCSYLDRVCQLCEGESECAGWRRAHLGDDESPTSGRRCEYIYVCVEHVVGRDVTIYMCVWNM